MWDTWYNRNTTNQMDNVYGPELCRALLSKLINSTLGVILKEVNARYTSLAKNKEIKFTLRGGLKVISGNASGGGATSRSAAYQQEFHRVIARGQDEVAAGGNVEQGVEGQPEEYEREQGDEELLAEYEREIFGEDLEVVDDADDVDVVIADEDGGDEEAEEAEEWEEFEKQERDKEMLE